MREERRYAEDRDSLLIVINDMAELQRGELTLSDTPNGRIHFRTQMYGLSHEYRFLVEEAPGGCAVTLEMDEPNAKSLIYKTFYLLESLMANHPDCNGHTQKEEDT